MGRSDGVTTDLRGTRPEEEIHRRGKIHGVSVGGGIREKKVRSGWTQTAGAEESDFSCPRKGKRTRGET